MTQETTFTIASLDMNLSGELSSLVCHDSPLPLYFYRSSA